MPASGSDSQKDSYCFDLHHENFCDLFLVYRPVLCINKSHSYLQLSNTPSTVLAEFGGVISLFGTIRNRATRTELYKSE